MGLSVTRAPSEPQTGAGLWYANSIQIYAACPGQAAPQKSEIQIWILPSENLEIGKKRRKITMEGT